MIIRLVTEELTGADLAESDTRTVVRIDVGCDLEDEACELRLVGLHHSLFGFRRLWVRCYLYEAVEKLLHTEVVER